MPELKVLRVSLIAGGLSVLLYFVPTGWWGLLLVVPVFAAFNGLNQSNLVGLLSRSASPRIQGEILGINASVQALAQTLPPLLSGVIAGRIGPGAPLIVAAVLHRERRSVLRLCLPTGRPAGGVSCGRVPSPRERTRCRTSRPNNATESS